MGTPRWGRIYTAPDTRVGTPRWGRVYTAPDAVITPETEFVEVGWTTDDGIVYNDDAPVGVLSARRVDLVVDRIDSAIADIYLATAGSPDEQLDVCACGCRQALRPDGPSFYFATSDCQQRWNRRAAAPPRVTEPGPDAYAVQHAEIPEARPCADLYGAAYRKQCPSCDTMVIPRMIPAAPLQPLNPDPFTRPVALFSGPINECPGCRGELPGPAYLAQVETRGGQLFLELSDGEIRASRSITVTELVRFNDRDGLYRIVWRSLERQLEVFRRGWHGSRTPGRRQEA